MKHEEYSVVLTRAELDWLIAAIQDQLGGLEGETDEGRWHEVYDIGQPLLERFMATKGTRLYTVTASRTVTVEAADELAAREVAQERLRERDPRDRWVIDDVQEKE